MTDIKEKNLEEAAVSTMSRRTVPTDLSAAPASIIPAEAISLSESVHTDKRPIKERRIFYDGYQRKEAR